MSSSGTDDREPVAADEPDAAIGFTRVDAQPDTATLIEGMDATAQWPAVKQLHAWEVARLGLRPGRSLLDVGCGVGSVATALAPLVAPGGTVAAVDPSEAMLAEGRRRAEAARVSVDFRAGLAEDLPFEDATFDVCRSERALQWMPDPEAALDEMIRTNAPGRSAGRDRHRLADARVRSPRRGARGSRSPRASVDSGAGPPPSAVVSSTCSVTGASRTSTSSARPMSGIAGSPTWRRRRRACSRCEPSRCSWWRSGGWSRRLGEQFSDQVTEAARRDRLSISLTMFAVHGRKPA